MATIMYFKEILGMLIFCVVFGPFYSESLKKWEEQHYDAKVLCMSKTSCQYYYLLIYPDKLKLTF